MACLHVIIVAGQPAVRHTMASLLHAHTCCHTCASRTPDRHVLLPCCHKVWCPITGTRYIPTGTRYTPLQLRLDTDIHHPYARTGKLRPPPAPCEMDVQQSSWHGGMSCCCSTSSTTATTVPVQQASRSVHGQSTCTYRSLLIDSSLAYKPKVAACVLSSKGGMSCRHNCSSKYCVACRLCTR